MAESVAWPKESDTKIVLHVKDASLGGFKLVEVRHGGNGSLSITEWRKPYDEAVKQHVDLMPKDWERVMAALRGLRDSGR